MDTNIKVSEDELRETIYSIMLEIALSNTSDDLINKISNDSTKPIVIKSLLAETIKSIATTNSNGFPTIRGHAVNFNNVPNDFKELFISLKSYIDCKSDFQRNIMLNKIVEEVEKRDMFKQMINKVISFYLECQKENSQIVTSDMIRETFYNIMAEQVFINGKITKDALLDMEAYIFYDLSTYVILASTFISLNYDGIILHNGTLVTSNNCPEEYKKFHTMMMNLKVKIKSMKLSAKQMEFINVYSSSNPEVTISPELETYKTPEIVNLVTIIKDLSIQISQVPHFKAIIDKVIKYCLDIM